MKRRNAECGKLRRPLKRSKITENLYSSTFLYVRFLMVWVIVLLGDFFLEFRFEYLWPAWLLIRSLYDSYRYQGLAFCVFFMCVALTSDVVCLLFMPAQWLFFVASTYVWVQLVWQTERGVCLPTVCLWLLFIYIEASVRLREFQKNMPFHLDLCRPFAAHCIGYPVVTLGFGVKSYVSYKVRQRRQKDVERENEFYVQLLQGALPPEMQQHLQQQRELDPELLTQSVMSEHGFVQRFEEASSQPATAVPASNGVANGVAGHHHHHHNHHHHNSTSRSSSKRGAHKSAAEPPNNHSRAELEFMEQQRRSSGGWRLGTSVNHFDDSEPEREKTCSKNGIAGRSRSSSSGRSTSGTAGTFASTSPSSPPPSSSSPSSGTASSTATTGTNTTSTTTTTEPNNNQHQQHSSKKHRHRDAQTAISKDDVNYQLYVQRLECDVKRLKAELCSIKGNESDLSGKLQTATAAEKGVRMELNQLQADNEALQTRLQGLVSQRQQDKQAIAQLERRLTDEKKSKQSLESQLSSERKAAANKERQQKKEQEEQQQAQARAQARASCGETCKQKQRDMESELKQLRNEVKVAEERRRHMERELQNARRVEEIMDEKDRLVAALSKMHQQHAHLEDSLSAETKLKLELFSALGDAKRQLAAKHNMLLAREREIEDLKSKVAEVLAVMPHHPQHSNLSFGSPLDPNARIYSPGVVGGLGSIQVPTSMGHQIQIPVSAAHSAILEALSDGHGD